MTDENTRAALEEMRAFEKAHRLQGEGGNRSETEMADRLKRWADALSALTVPDGDVRERLADLLEELDGTDYMDMADAVLAAFPVLSRAAAPEPLHESPAIQAARDVLDGLEDWEIQDHALGEIRSALDDIPCCESATAMVHAEDHGAPEPEWEFGTAHADHPQNVAVEPSLEAAQRRVASWNRGDPERKGIVVRAPKRVWEPLPVGGETE